MKLKIDKRWEFLSLDDTGWFLYERMPLFFNNVEWWIKDDGAMTQITSWLFDLPKFDGKPKLFKHDDNKWIEVPKNQWKTDKKA